MAGGAGEEECGRWEVGVDGGGVRCWGEVLKVVEGVRG